MKFKQMLAFKEFSSTVVDQGNRFTSLSTFLTLTPVKLNEMQRNVNLTELNAEALMECLCMQVVSI